MGRFRQRNDDDVIYVYSKKIFQTFEKNVRRQEIHYFENHQFHGDITSIASTLYIHTFRVIKQITLSCFKEIYILYCDINIIYS